MYFQIHLLYNINQLEQEGKKEHRSELEHRGAQVIADSYFSSIEGK